MLNSDSYLHTQYDFCFGVITNQRVRVAATWEVEKILPKIDEGQALAVEDKLRLRCQACRDEILITIFATRLEH